MIHGTFSVLRVAQLIQFISLSWAKKENKLSIGVVC